MRKREVFGENFKLDGGEKYVRFSWKVKNIFQSQLSFGLRGHVENVRNNDIGKSTVKQVVILKRKKHVGK